MNFPTLKKQKTRHLMLEVTSSSSSDSKLTKIEQKELESSLLYSQFELQIALKMAQEMENDSIRVNERANGFKLKLEHQKNDFENGVQILDLRIKGLNVESEKSQSQNKLLEHALNDMIELCGNESNGRLKCEEELVQTSSELFIQRDKIEQLHASIQTMNDLQIQKLNQKDVLQTYLEEQLRQSSASFDEEINRLKEQITDKDSIIEIRTRQSQDIVQDLNESKLLLLEKDAKINELEALVLEVGNQKNNSNKYIHIFVITFSSYESNSQSEYAN